MPRPTAIVRREGCAAAMRRIATQMPLRYGSALAALAVAILASAPAGAQGSLVVNPQQGATPRPLPPSPSLPPASTPAPAPSVIPDPPTTGPLLSVPAVAPTLPREGGAYGPPVDPRDQPLLRDRPGGLPAPSEDPLHIDPARDPVLALVRVQASAPAFRAAIGEAVRRNPSLDEATAQADEARGVAAEARARVLPVADLSVTSFGIFSRAFSNDPRNVLERSRPRHRTDGLARIQQPFIDFGSSLNRIRAGEARLAAARAAVEDVATQIALRGVSAWYSVYGTRVLVRLGEAFVEGQRGLRGSLEQRVRQGAAASGDIAQVDSYIASAEAQLADFRRQRAGAEAQYAAVIGNPPPPELGRAPVPELGNVSAGTLASDADALPAVRAARFGVEAARRDARALKSDRLPQLSVGVDAGRYGVFETERDYDIRGSVTVSMRLGGGAALRVDQAEARAQGADARLRRTRIDATRDAEIALADVAALDEARIAIEGNYIASRRSRDVLAERFRVSRGTLFDLLAAENNYFGVAARLIQTVIELDTARYALLARTGRLLPALAIQPAALEPR